ncbi:MAG: hypothetical protein ABUL57_01250 [Chloroflexota bacterium]
MPPTVTAFWNKLNANETKVMYGAGITILGNLLALGGAYGTFGLVAAIGVIVVYWLKYSGSNITWPMPVQTIVLALTGISGLFAVIGLLFGLSLIFYFGVYGIGLVISAIGAIMMAWFAYKEYQAMPKASAPTPPAPPAPPAA